VICLARANFGSAQTLDNLQRIENWVPESQEGMLGILCQYKVELCALIKQMTIIELVGERTCTLYSVISWHLDVMFLEHRQHISMS
jgi:hypothetical protein